MCKVICTVSCKGGCGKTTLTANISSYISKQSKKVCVIDLDPQHSLTTHFGVQQPQLENRSTIYDIFSYLLMEDDWDDTEFYKLLKTCIYHKTKLDIIPAVTRLANLQKVLPSAPQCEHLLEYAVSFLKAEYDYIFLDCHSGFDLYAQNALTASDYVIIPVEASIFGCEGLSEILPVIKGVQKRLNNNLQIAGIAFNRFRGYRKNAAAFKDLVLAEFGEVVPIFKSYIMEREAVTVAPNYGDSIFEYDPHNAAAIALADLAKEVMACA